MGKLKARYFDGITSKPREIWLMVYGESELFLLSNEETGVPFEKWELLLIKKDSFNSSNGYQLSYIVNGVTKSIELDETDESLRNFINKGNSHETKLFDFVLKRNAVKVIVSGVLILSLLIFVYVKWVSIYVGNAIVSLIPISVEETIGNTAFNQMGFILEIDSSKSETLQEFYDALNFDSEYHISTYLDTTKMVNAFALPGGKLVVYDGLIKKTESWQELAALFGHELSHVNHRHSMRLMARELGNYAVFSAVTGDMAGISSVIVESAISLNELVYSRTYEKEADMEGLQLLIENEIDPAGMLGLFERLHDENREVDGVMENLEMLSTHPLTDNRVGYIEGWISIKELTDYKGVENEEAQRLWLKLKE